jgi:hypothetical protein
MVNNVRLGRDMEGGGGGGYQEEERRIHAREADVDG